jgi:hypothetical protein
LSCTVEVFNLLFLVVFNGCQKTQSTLSKFVAKYRMNESTVIGQRVVHRYRFNAVNRGGITTLNGVLRPVPTHRHRIEIQIRLLTGAMRDLDIGVGRQAIPQIERRGAGLVFGALVVF